MTARDDRPFQNFHCRRLLFQGSYTPTAGSTLIRVKGIGQANTHEELLEGLSILIRLAWSPAPLTLDSDWLCHVLKHSTTFVIPTFILRIWPELPDHEAYTVSWSSAYIVVVSHDSNKWWRSLVKYPKSTESIWVNLQLSSFLLSFPVSFYRNQQVSILSLLAAHSFCCANFSIYLKKTLSIPATCRSQDSPSSSLQPWWQLHMQRR